MSIDIGRAEEVVGTGGFFTPAILGAAVDTLHNVESGINYQSSSTESSFEGAADPIAEAIRLLRPRTEIEDSLRIAGSCAVRFDPFPHVKMGVVVHGDCWLALEGQKPVLLHSGDIYLLGNPPPYVLSKTLDGPPRRAMTVKESAAAHLDLHGPENLDDVYVCGGHFSFDERNAGVVLDVLPTLVLVRAADPRGELLAHLSALMVAEIEAAGGGSSFILEHLAQILFVHMLRAHAEQAARPTGWLGALNDDGIGAVLRAMHADVAHRWTLVELAAISRMSRSAFAAAFKRQVGSAPLEYLIHWRMSLARDALCRGTRTISELAAATGYESESAFSTAFRRVVGTSPKFFRDAAQAATFSARGPSDTAGADVA